MREELNLIEKEKETRKKKNKYKKKYDETTNIYSIFTKKPSDFRELWSKQRDNYSSSSEETESSDDFPSPDTPIIRKIKEDKNTNTNNDELFNKIKELQSILNEMEIQNRKLKSQNKLI